MRELSSEEKITNEATREHIALVAKNIHIVVKQLLDRADGHDLSKLNIEESIEEIWKPVYEWENYEISNFGKVRRLSDKKLIKSYPTPKGYRRVQLSNSGKQKNKLIHVLVAQSFIENPDNLSQINHINGIKDDNYVGNLEWISPCGNLLHAHRTGLKKSPIKYVIYCKELEISALGCERMANKLRELGYSQANPSGIWRCIKNPDSKHLDLSFSSKAFEPWMHDPLNHVMVSLVELFCGWVTICKAQNKDIYSFIDAKANSLGIDPDLVMIFKNTVPLME